MFEIEQKMVYRAFDSMIWHAKNSSKTSVRKDGKILIDMYLQDELKETGEILLRLYQRFSNPIYSGKDTWRRAAGDYIMSLPDGDLTFAQKARGLADKGRGFEQSIKSLLQMGLEHGGTVDWAMLGTEMYQLGQPEDRDRVSLKWAHDFFTRPRKD